MVLYFSAVVALVALMLVTIRFFKEKDRIGSGVVRIVVGNVFIIMIVLLVCFVAGESYYRFAYDTTDSFGFTLVTKRWMERHFTQRNNFGFRDNIDYSYVPEEGKRRISFVGDSFTEGHGVADVNDRFANVIRKNKPEWDVHCLAVSGASTIGEVTLLRRLLSDNYRIATVVLVFCLNDSVENSEEWKTRCALLKKEYDRESYLLNNSYFINTLYFRLKRINDPLVGDYFGDLEKYYQGSCWEIEKNALRHLRAMVRNHGGNLMVVLFPFLHALGDSDHPLGDSYPFCKIHEGLVSFLHDNNIPCLDLLKTYSAHQSSDLVVNEYDSHPNDFAHGIAAKEIIEFIEGEGGKD